MLGRDEPTGGHTRELLQLKRNVSVTTPQPLPQTACACPFIPFKLLWVCDVLSIASGRGWQMRAARIDKVTAGGEGRLAHSLGRTVSVGASNPAQAAADFWYGFFICHEPCFGIVRVYCASASSHLSQLGREALSCDLPPCKQPLRDDIPTILNALNKCGKDRTGTDLLLLQNLCRHLEVFKSLKDSAVTELCRVVTLTTIGAGQAVFCAGDIGTAYFAILKGRVAVLIPQNEKETLQAAKKKLTPKVARDMLMIPSTPKGKKDSQRKVSMRRGSMGELPATVPLVSLRVRKLGATDNEQTIKAYEDLVSEELVSERRNI